MRTDLLPLLLLSLSACHVAPAGHAAPMNPGSPQSNLTGQWQVEAITPPGQPFPGTYTTVWDLQGSGAQISGVGVWSNGAQSRYSGWINGASVHLDRVDSNGFRGGFDAKLSPDGNSMTGTGRNDPSAPGGNTATYSWTARRVGAPPPSYAAPTQPASGLTGQWRAEAITPPGQPFPGTYTTTWDLQESSGRISGTGVWSNGTQSRYSGQISGASVHLERVDSSGFRGSFNGTLSPDGRSMTGGGRNDPTSPGGNTASYSWSAKRM